MSELAPEIVWAHVNRISQSRMFVDSERLRRFLAFTVESKLRGDASDIKEYAIGRQVFDRDRAYDPRVDPIVRVEARRLRTKLEEYYSGPGSGESLRIDYPRGSYVPEISAKASAHRLSYRILFLPPAIVAAIAVGFLGVRTGALNSSKPTLLAVMPAQWLFHQDDGLDPSAVGISEQLNVELAHRGAPNIAGWPIVQSRHHSIGDIRDLPRILSASRALAISVRRDEDTTIVTAFLIDATTGRKLRAAEVIDGRADTIWTQRIVARELAEQLRRYLH